MIMTVLQVAVGGALGATGRYLVNVSAMRLLGPGFPWGTVVVNVVGSFLMGLLVVVLARRGGTHLAPFLMTGLLGGFTTFSAFSLDSATLWQRGEVGLMAVYVMGTVLVSIAALFVALWLGRGWLE